MLLPTPEKEATIAELKERIQNNEIAILARYIGINVEQVTDLRKQLRDQGALFKVYKNTLAKRALDELGYSEAAAFLDGPVAWAFCQDPLVPAKILKEFAKKVDRVGMNGGILAGRVVSAERLVALADLPGKEVLLAQTVGTIAAPLRNLVGVLNALPRNMVNVIDQIRKQKEEQQAA